NLAGFLSSKPLKGVYSSDLVRASRGAEIIGERLGVPRFRLSALRELHLGRWEGLTREEAVMKYPEDAGFSFRSLAGEKVFGGETLEDLRLRVMPAIGGIVSSHAGGSVLIIAHGGVNRVVLCEAMGLDLSNFFRLEQDYGCLNIIDYFDDNVSVVKVLNGGPNQEMGATKVY
ncbi:MAG: histidine phosphatase family protein, partial [Thermodesulfobacteriota bacterium]